MKLSVCKEQRVTKEKVRQAMKGEVAKTDTKKKSCKATLESESQRASFEITTAGPFYGVGA